jgi:hypothetical protein
MRAGAEPHRGVELVVVRRMGACAIGKLRRLALGLVLAGALGGASGPSSAQTARRRARIVVTYDPGSEKQRQTLTAVEAHLQGLPVEVVAQPARRGGDLADRLKGSGTLASSNEALGTFSIEEGPDSSILVFLTEAGGEATLIRLLPPSQRSKRLASEQAAIVVRSLVESLLDGGRIVVGPVAAPTDPKSRAERPPAPPPVPPKQAHAGGPATNHEQPALPDGVEGTKQNAGTAPARLSVLAGYAGSVPGGGFPWQSGASVGLRWFLNPTMYVGARYIFTPAAERNLPAVRLSISHHPMEVMLGYATRSRVAPVAEFSFIAEQTTRETTSTDPGLAPTPPRSQWSLGVGPRVGAMFRPLPAVSASLRVGVDFFLNRPSYSTDEELVLAPAAVRPRLDLEMGLGVW